MNENITSALELLTSLKEQGVFEIKIPIDVEKIAEKLDIVVEDDFSLELRDVVGEIFFNDNNKKPVIKINPIQNSYMPRRRFTLAHEIGHYCLHSKKSAQGFTDSMKTMSRTESYWNTLESEANNFAAQLLMPRSLIIDKGQKYIKSYRENTGQEKIEPSLFIKAMADIFEVSNKAMEYRLKNMGIVK